MAKIVLENTSKRHHSQKNVFSGKLLGLVLRKIVFPKIIGISSQKNCFLGKKTTKNLVKQWTMLDPL